MKKISSFHRHFLTALLAALISCATAAAQTTDFSYQGFITDNNAPANGNFDFEFRLFDSVGNVLGTIQRTNVPVANGVFNVTLNFPTQPFTGGDRFLETAVKPAGGGSFTTLAPRQKVLSAPYAIFSNVAQTSIDSTRLGNIPSSQYVLTTDPRMSDARSPLPNSTNYIQNRSSQQTGTANFNISGDGTVGGEMLGNVITTKTSFNLFLTGRILGKAGVNNLYVGALAGSTNSGQRNTLVGDSAGKLTTGDENTMLGFVAGQDSTTGSFNTFIGSRTGSANRTGSNNTFLGYNADAGSNNLTNATAIGANAFVEQNNAIVLGSINGVNGAIVSTDVGIGVTQPARKLDVSGIIRVGSTTGTIGCIEDRDGTVIAGVCASDLRFKKEVKPFGSVLNSFSKLRPVNYFWRADEFPDQHFGTKQSYGLIAQEVEEIFPDLVTIDDKGFKAVNYTKLPLYTIQAVKEQQVQIEAQAKEIAAQKETNRKLQEKVEALVRLACKSDPSVEVCKEER